MNHTEYRKIEALNSSSFRYLERSPWHYKQWRDGFIDDKPSEAMNMGIAVHSAILEPNDFANDFLCLPDTSMLDSPGKKAALTKSAKRDLAGDSRLLLSYADYQRVINMREKVLAHPYARYLIESSEHEVTRTWVDTSGAACKGRFDLYRPESSTIADIKTMTDVSDDAFTKYLYNYKLPRQAAFYLDGSDSSSFIWILVENVHPYSIRVIQCQQYMLEIGRKSYKPLAELYQKCTLSGNWPSFSSDIQTEWYPASSSSLVEASI